jgi:hypothetical protein
MEFAGMRVFGRTRPGGKIHPAKAAGFNAPLTLKGHIS